MVSSAAFLHRVRRLASEIGAIRRISHHNFRKLKMWPVTTLLVLGAVARAISQTPLLRAHPGYEADHCHRCLQMPENNDDILFNIPFIRKVMKQTESFKSCLPCGMRSLFLWGKSSLKTMTKSKKRGKRR